jgi:hypothetical protein
MKDKPVYTDLGTLWRDLGVNSSNGVVSLADSAPLASIRRSITNANPMYRQGEKKITSAP